MDTPKFSKSISSSPGDDLKTKNPVKLPSQKSVLWPIQRHMGFKRFQTDEVTFSVTGIGAVQYAT